MTKKKTHLEILPSRNNTHSFYSWRLLATIYLVQALLSKLFMIKVFVELAFRTIRELIPQWVSRFTTCIKMILDDIFALPSIWSLS